MNKDLLDSFDALERLFKLSQLFLHEFKTSVLNEYRYCARAMVDFHKTLDKDDQAEALQRVKIAISSAYVDILDYLVHSIKGTVNEIRVAHWSPDAQGIFNEFGYVNVIKSLKVADNLIIQTRVDRVTRLTAYIDFCNSDDFTTLAEFASRFSELIFRLECDKDNKFNKIELTKILHSALNGDPQAKFVLHFQPKLKLFKKTDGSFCSEIVGAEALVRLQLMELEDDKVRIIKPDKFLDLISEINMHSKLHDIVLNDAAENLKKWMFNYQLPVDFDLSINVSPTLFIDQSFAMNFRQVVQMHSVSKHLSIEILEDWSDDNQRVVAHVAYSLNELNSNTSIHIDDFGTGSTKLSYISDIPYIDYLKIDKSIIDGLLSKKRETAKAHIAGIVAFANATGKRVLAEGVEKDCQITDLFDVGVKNFQGWHALLGEDLPANEFEEKWLVSVLPQC